MAPCNEEFSGVKSAPGDLYIRCETDAVCDHVPACQLGIECTTPSWHDPQAAYALPGHDTRAVATTRTMLLPGSTAVHDRASGQLVSCTPYSCPAGVPAAGSGFGGNGGDGDGGSSTWGQLWAWLAGPTEEVTVGAGGAVVNLAPLVYGSPVGAITISAPYASRSAGAALLELLASEEGQQALWDDASAGGHAPSPMQPAKVCPCSFGVIESCHRVGRTSCGRRGFWQGSTAQPALGHKPDIHTGETYVMGPSGPSCCPRAFLTFGIRLPCQATGKDDAVGSASMSDGHLRLRCCTLSLACSRCAAVPALCRCCVPSDRDSQHDGRSLIGCSTQSRSLEPSAAARAGSAAAAPSSQHQHRSGAAPVRRGAHVVSAIAIQASVDLSCTVARQLLDHLHASFAQARSHLLRTRTLDILQAHHGQHRPVPVRK